MKNPFEELLVSQSEEAPKTGDAMESMPPVLGHKGEVEDVIESEVHGDEVVYRQVYSDGSVEMEWHPLNSNPSDTESVKTELEQIKKQIRAERGTE